jgi:hypothetical protein
VLLIVAGKVVVSASFWAAACRFLAKSNLGPPSSPAYRSPRRTSYRLKREDCFIPLVLITPEPRVAERQRKRRAKLAHAQELEWKPDYKLPLTSTNWRHNEFVERLHNWLEYGDIEQVTEFLADIGRWLSIRFPPLVRLPA